MTPAAKTATDNGNNVDTKGFNDAELIVLAGAINPDGAATDQHYTVRVQDSSDQSSWSNVTDVDGNNIEVVAHPSSNDISNTVHALRIGQLGRLNRYLRARIEIEGTTPSATIGAAIALGRAFDEPVGN